MLLKHIGKIVRSNRAVANMKQAEEHASVNFSFFSFFFLEGEVKHYRMPRKVI